MLRLSDTCYKMLQAAAAGDDLNYVGKEYQTEWDTMKNLGLVEPNFDTFEYDLTTAGVLHLAEWEMSNAL